MNPIAYGLWAALVVVLIVGGAVVLGGILRKPDRPAVVPKAVLRWTRIDWEVVDDYGVKLPLDIASHHGHRLVALYGATGWDFNNWHCLQCNQGCAERGHVLPPVRMFNVRGGR